MRTQNILNTDDFFFEGSLHLDKFTLPGLIFKPFRLYFLDQIKVVVFIVLTAFAFLASFKFFFTDV